MAEFGRTLEEEISEWASKIQKGVLPPDPGRVVREILESPIEIEHVLPIPSIVEDIHAEHVEPAIEDLPRLPMTGDFPIEKWKKWRRE